MRSKLNYFSIMDTIITIGDEYQDKLDRVNNNAIPQRYKSICTYNEYVESQPKKSKRLLKKFPYSIECEDKSGNEVSIDFIIKGWIGTVNTLPEFAVYRRRA